MIAKFNGNHPIQYLFINPIFEFGYLKHYIVLNLKDGPAGNLFNQRVFGFTGLQVCCLLLVLQILQDQTAIK